MLTAFPGPRAELPPNRLQQSDSASYSEESLKC